MSTTTTTTNLFSFPFNHVIITFPDAAAAHTAELGPIKSLTQRPIYKDVRFTATADPYDARVGSGGGTAAALYDHIKTTEATRTSDGESNTTRITSEPTKVDEARLTETVLILHAGGAASRCPTQMCLGKAWTSLPTLLSSGISLSNIQEQRNHVMTQSLNTPLHIWLDLCHRIFSGDGRTLPVGSVVVVASDTLLQLDDDNDCGNMMNSNNFTKIDWIKELEGTNTVLGLAVPAQLSTAKNHGVFVVSKPTSTCDGNISSIRVRPCHNVLQKPSIPCMESTTNCCFALPSKSMINDGAADNGKDNIDNQKYAWIDTGVTIFSPLAALTLYNLTRQHLQRCTATGLLEMYNHQLVEPNRIKNSDACAISVLTTFASKNAMSVDLYTHFLQALSYSNETSESQLERKSKFIETYSSELPSEVILAMWNAFSSCTLQILVVPDGRFWHLGTTKELHDFLVDACGTINDNTIHSSKQSQCQRFGLQLGLTKRLRAYTCLGGNYDGSSCVDSTVVIYDSILSVNRSESGGATSIIRSSIGCRTIVEHCHITTADQIIRIGSNCLVSGLRMPYNTKCQMSLHIPDNTIVQMVQLSTKVVSNNPVVIIVLNMSDDIKKGTTIYGQPVELFLENSGLKFDDIWDVSDSPPSIWSAKIHPYISLSTDKSYATVFSWLNHLDSIINGSKSDSLIHDVSFVNWKNSRRLSLCELRDLSDAPHEFSYREELIAQKMLHFKSKYIDSLRTTLCERRYSESIDFQFLVDGYTSSVRAIGQESSFVSICDLLDSLRALDNIILDTINCHGSRDITARTLMLISGLLDGIINATSELVSTNISDDETHSLASITSSIRREGNNLDFSDVYNNLVLIRDRFISEGQIQGVTLLVSVLEEFASMMTGLHVSAASGLQKSVRCHQPIFDSWIIASAPARVDLSGGWSDTPPICYEFGSLVVGIAVLIDNKKPLVCRCRIVSGGTGIWLRSENRSMDTGEILMETETEVRSFECFSNYRDPTSDCALLKCVLVHLGFIIPENNDDGNDFQLSVNAFCRSGTTSARLEVVATSILPHGSGLGTSSILGGCILAAIGKCIGTGNPSSSEYIYELIDSVLNVEQYLTTGGGFQDQANGLISGVKVVSSTQKSFPMKIEVEKLTISTTFQMELSENIILVFTGKTRLAKNLLKQVLYRWSKQTSEILETINGLVDGAKKCRDAMKSGDLNETANCLTQYWMLKKVMAGPSSGAEPEIVTNVIEALNKRHLIRGSSLCGAGGGGFMVLIAAPGVSMSELQSAVHNDLCCDRDTVASFTWHSCSVCAEGLSVDKVIDVHDVHDFSMNWLSPRTGSVFE
jgi:galactokinase/mevalonate kinase-like predicted kinase